MMLKYQVLNKLITENKLKEYDSINLACYGYFFKYNTNIVKHNEIPTLLTKCEVAVVVSE